MTPAESPTTAGPHGPEVGDDEELYRCIAYPNWWNEQEQKRKTIARKLVEASDLARLLWPARQLAASDSLCWQGLIE
jgi:hypothetical protein